MPSLQERLSTLQSERGHLVANCEAAMQASFDENRDLNDAETLAIGTMTERIQVVDGQLETLSAAEQMLMRRAAPVPALIPGNRPGSTVHLPAVRERPHIEMRRRDEYKGSGFTRWAIACCVAGSWNAAEYARQRWGDDDLADTIAYANWFGRAATDPQIGGPGAMNPSPPTSVPAAGPDSGGFLVRLEHMGGEFIELLRPMLIAARLPSMRRLQFNAAGTLLIPRQTGGVTGGYIGEGQNIWVQRLTFGQLQLTPAKLAVIVPMTNELMHRSDPGIEMLVRDDMVEGTARTIDTNFFSTAAAGVGASPPGGILSPPVAQNLGGRFDDETTQGPMAVADATTALKNMIMALRLANVPFLAPVWIMHARTKEYLRLLRSQIDVFVFKAEIDAGTLLGYPIIDSTNIAIPFIPPAGPIPATNTGYALVDASQLIWAEDMLPLLDASEHASIYSATPGGTGGLPPGGTQIGPPAAGLPYYSAFQNDMIFLRIRMRHTWNRRHDVAVTWAVVGAGLGTPAAP
jgi:HK97 family phage major capsid protein